MEKYVVIDGGSFDGVDLRDTVLIYRGGEIPSFAGATFGTSFGLAFEDAALRAFQLAAYLETISPGITANMLKKAADDVAKMTRPRAVN